MPVAVEKQHARRINLPGKRDKREEDGEGEATEGEEEKWCAETGLIFLVRTRLTGLPFCPVETTCRFRMYDIMCFSQSLSGCADKRRRH
jgi:hypothetical protein